MATATTIVVPEGWMSVSEYLQSSFEPDADYVDGFIEERNLGEIEHASWQVALTTWFTMHRADLQLVAFSKMRLKVSEARFRVPDVAVYEVARRPSEAVPSSPPLAVFEIMSTDDRFGRFLVRLEDYRRMGVRNIFVIGNEGVTYRYRDGSLEILTQTKSELDGNGTILRWGEIEGLRY